MSNETDIESAFVEYAASKGCIAVKLRIDGQNGWPDRTVITPNGVLFLEFKLHNGRLRPMQKVWSKLLASVGHKVHVPRTIDEAKRILERVL